MNKKKSSSLSKSNTSVSSSDEIDAFLKTIEQTPPITTDGRRGRLIFSLDATASRQPTWDYARELTIQMFTQTRGLGSLDIQLVYYRGYDECRSSRWINSPDKLATLMGKVQCLAGRTQIKRILKHALAETKDNPVEALVFIGDCVEEDADQLGNLAGQLRLLNLPVFIFQEGYQLEATSIFKQIAQLSGGAHCRFDQSSAHQLGELLNAVAVYAAGGKEALQRLEKQGSKQATALLSQLS